MTVSQIKPISKSVKAYYNYIFNDPHNGKEARNLSVFATGDIDGFEPADAYDYMAFERDATPNRRRKHEAYTAVISFAKDEIDPDNPADIEKAETMVREIMQEAYPDRSAMATLQADGKGGCLHAHILINNVDSNGKALHDNSWYHLKGKTDEVTQKHGLTPLTQNKADKGHYDWRKDLGTRLRDTASMDDLEALGVTYTERFRKRDKSTQLTFSFEDAAGKKRRIRGGALSEKLGIEDDNYYSLENMMKRQEEKQEKEKASEAPKEIELAFDELEQEELDGDGFDFDLGDLEQGQGMQM